MRILILSGPLCAASKDLYFDVDPKRFIEPGLHLGSRCPVNPETTAIFDFLPAKLLNQITNRGDFVKCLVLDTLIGQWDKRQAVFVRDRVSKSRPACRAYLIDHGMSFGGSHWEQLGQRTTGIYLDYSVYRSLDLAPVWIEALERACAISEHDLATAAGEIPDTWFADGDHAALREVFSMVLHRQTELRSKVQTQLQTLGFDFELSNSACSWSA